MGKKNKTHSLSTGSIVTIVLGVLIFAFMILSFANHQIEQSRGQDSEETGLYCDEGMILGDDKMCHEQCGESEYCKGKNICYNEECYTYPSRAVLCLDELKKDMKEYNLGIAVVNRLPYETCYESWFKYDKASRLLLGLSNSSEECLDEVNNKDFILDELGYDIDTYLDGWDNATSEMAYLLLKQKVALEQDCN